MENVRIWRVCNQSENQLIEEKIIGSPGLTLNEITRFFPDGGYTTFRTYQRSKVLRLSHHFTRLRETTKISQNTELLLDEQRVRQALRQIIGFYSDLDLRIRLVIDYGKMQNNLFIMVDRLHLPSAEDYEHGVEVVTQEFARINPKAKLTNFISPAIELRNSLDIDVHEILMCDGNGFILEGLSSNFFAICTQTIFTSEEGILSGITRSFVLDLVASLDLQINYLPVSINQIPSLTEAFITSASRSILPIRSINHIVIGNGNPGPVTQKLSSTFKNRLNTELEFI